MPFYEEFLSFLEKNFIENNTFYLLGNNQYLLTSTSLYLPNNNKNYSIKDKNEKCEIVFPKHKLEDSEIYKIVIVT